MLMGFREPKHSDGKTDGASDCLISLARANTLVSSRLPTPCFRPSPCPLAKTHSFPLVLLYHHQVQSDTD